MEQVRIEVDVEVTTVAAPPLVLAAEPSEISGRGNRAVLLEPAASVIKLFGGFRAVAQICGVHPTRVYRWQRPSEVDGTGGLIPQRHHLALIEFAEENGVPFDPAMLIRMRKAAA